MMAGIPSMNWHLGEELGVSGQQRFLQFPRDSVVDMPDEDDPIPAPRRGKLHRQLRWTVFSVYRRLFTFCVLANIVALIVVGVTRNLSFQNCSSAAAINILVALLVRQEHVVNALFVTATSIPTSWPFWLRRRVAKVYCYGGWHSGCAITGAVWYAVFAGYLTHDFVLFSPELLPVVVTTYINISLFILTIVFALPSMRRKLHDYFEMTHRFAGWSIIGLFWAQVILIATIEPGSTGLALMNSPSFWCLVISTGLIIYPWARLRKRTVYFEYLSAHAVRLHFLYANFDYCIGVRLSTNPLFETHAFATVPNRAEEGRGFSVLISNAGDWTKKRINSAASLPDLPNASLVKSIQGKASTEVTVADGKAFHCPSVSEKTADSRPNSSRQSSQTSIIPKQWREDKIYTRGAPIYGVLRVADLFINPIIVTTGSGIGPCLSLLAGRPDVGSKWTCRILWATKRPLQTYGQSIIDDVMRADPNAKIIDTGSGRPDLLQETWQMWRRSGNRKVSSEADPELADEQRQQSIIAGPRSEAIIVISNPKVTKEVVNGLEIRGVPIYGVIFDS